MSVDGILYKGDTHVLNGTTVTEMTRNDVAHPYDKYDGIKFSSSWTDPGVPQYSNFMMFDGPGQLSNWNINGKTAQSPGPWIQRTPYGDTFTKNSSGDYIHKYGSNLPGVNHPKFEQYNADGSSFTPSLSSNGVDWQYKFTKSPNRYYGNNAIFAAPIGLNLVQQTEQDKSILPF